jgi:hypothetical protein
MSEEDILRELQALRSAVHGAHKRWYERSPGKELISHAVAVSLASGIALTIHFTTGAPVTIEAKNGGEGRGLALPTIVALPPPAASALAATAVATVEEDAATVVANDTPPPPDPAPKVAPKAVRKHVRPAVQPIEIAAAPAASQPATPAAAAGANPLSAVPAPATVQPVLQEIEIRGRP